MACLVAAASAVLARNCFGNMADPLTYDRWPYNGQWRNKNNRALTPVIFRPRFLVSGVGNHELCGQRRRLPGVGLLERVGDHHRGRGEAHPL